MSNPLRILDEHRIDLDGICELLGTADKPASQATGRRAMNRGSATPDGWTYLEHLHVGGKVISISGGRRALPGGDQRHFARADRGRRAGPRAPRAPPG